MKNRKKQPYRYSILIITLLALMSIPQGSAEKSRGLAMAITAPLFQNIQAFKIGAVNWFSRKKTRKYISPNPAIQTDEEELQRLRTENKVLTAQLLHTRELLENEIELRYYIDMLREHDDEAFHWLDQQAHDRHANLRDFLNLTLQSIPARVFFRSPSSWNSSLWIDVGTDDNPRIIAKNSPVLCGGSVIGVIDYAGKKQSRVKLITDSGLTPSVRAVRRENNQIWNLAKGELHGSSEPLWRGKKQTLQGIGFNYDFPDDEGPARDLRTGVALDRRENTPAMAIIQINDLLVTTGMDGVFPPGLSVGTVTDIQLLKEGDYTYTISALPTAENLDDLSLVFVIPPYGFNPLEQPPHLGSH